VSPFVLLVLKAAFLALLYFFIFRAVRAVVVDLRTSPRRARSAETKPVRASRPVRRSGKAPTSVVIRGEDGRKAGSHKLAGAAVQIGRAEACHIRPEDTYVSQFHARLYSKNGAWFVEDLGSTNGTYLNRQRLTSPAEVQAGDEIRVGKTVLELRR
jgi:pSer/pThr/pTyr-binding forkhead associated (FHA) protein